MAASEDSRPVSITTIHRGHNQQEFDREYNKMEIKDQTCGERMRNIFRCSASCLSSQMKRHFPVISFVTSYKLKSYLFRDFLSGICIGFMSVPQSLGYARIGKIPEVLGLYTSIFPVIVYFFFTSSKHVSIGTLAIISLVLRNAVESLTLPSEVFLNSANHSLIHNSTLIEGLRLEDESAIVILIASLCCTSSIILIVMSVFKFGFLISFMSEAFIGSFLSANLVRIFVFQYKDILGLVKVKKHSGVFEFFLNAYEIFRESHKGNLVGVAMGVITLNILLFVKYFLNDKFRRRFKFPIPVEIGVVIAAVLCNRGLELEANYGIEILTGMKSGMPKIVMPSPTLMYQYVFDAFLCGIMTYLLVGMMAKLFAQNYGYEVDPNQEMFALGISGLLSCFFGVIMPSVSPARCFLMGSTGGKTQACHLFTAAFSLFTMLLFASFMRDLPVCVLSSIIIVALVPVMRYFLDPFHLYKTNKYDLMIWLVTFWATLIFTVQEGMIIGIGFSMILVHVWMLKEARGSFLAKHSNGMFLDREVYSMEGRAEEEELQGVEGGMEEAVKEGRIFLFKFEAPIYFSTLDSFKNLLFSRIPSPTMLKKENIHVEKMKKKILKRKLKQKTADGMPKEDYLATSYTVNKELDDKIALKIQPTSASDLDSDDEIFLKDRNLTPSRLRCIILDFSAITLMDTHSAKCIAFLHHEYRKYGVALLIAACNVNVSKLMHQVEECDEIVKHHLYPTVADAFITSYAIHTSNSGNNI